MKNSVVLHCDTGGRPYRAEDFVPPLNQMGVLQDLAGLGAYEMGHVWLAKMKNSEAKSKLLHAGELQVKGRRCLVIDPYRRDIKVKLHWVTFDVPVYTVRRAFEPYGEVKEVVREIWKLNGLVGVELVNSARRSRAIQKRSIWSAHIPLADLAQVGHLPLVDLWQRPLHGAPQTPPNLLCGISQISPEIDRAAHVISV